MRVVSALVFIIQLIKVSSRCLVAINCIDGILFGCDSQSSSGGNLISNRESNDIFQLNCDQTILLASANDKIRSLFDNILRDIDSELREQALSLKSIAEYIRKKIHKKYKSAHILIIGLNEINNKGNIYEILPAGTLIQQDYVITGSSANQLYPLLHALCDHTSESPTTPANNANIDIWKTHPSTSNSEDNTSSTSLLPTKVAYINLMTVLRSARQLDPKSGGRLHVWLLSRGNKLSSISSEKDLPFIEKGLSTSLPVV